MRIMIEIIEDLEQARIAANLSGRELSTRAGLTPSHWWQISKRSKSANFETLARIAEVLGFAIVVIPVPVTE